LEITEQALSANGFSKEAIDVAADAAQDPDFYDWNTPQAHAQTSNDQDGRTIQSRQSAINAYCRWIGDLHEMMLDAAASDVRNSLFYLGYLLHGIQDLATHQGITNAQHSYLTEKLGRDHDPDHLEANRALALDFSQRYLEAFKKKHPALFNKLADWGGRSLLWERLLKSEKERLLGRGWDIGFKDYWAYQNLDGKYKDIKAKNPIPPTRWSTKSVMLRLIKVIRE
jgi:hypothetical protein